MHLLGKHTRSNKTHLKDDFYVVSALKSGSCTTEPFVDDLQAFLGLDSLSSVKFFPFCIVSFETVQKGFQKKHIHSCIQIG